MFPDIANVFHIREALWRHRSIGNASVMIGAGFSRNADPVSSTSRPMPNWSEMAKALCGPLYPTDGKRHHEALKEASSTSGFLRMAQEYQVAFGSGALNDKIRSLVPDTEYKPSELHKRMLRLPWADIFTTNWDTLLERTCIDVFERSYDVVRTLSEVPFAARPRIVKLHGTFPAHEPFIFTEEDYRKFPAKFAPMVNLVQQSMMETIFCLIGFSGDDPNFLHWSGWVRDNLGPSAPKIYLIGWLELSVHRRRMLEERNVMPIDLSALPQSLNWPEALRHKYAMEWFLGMLERGKPYDPSLWPSDDGPEPEAPTYLTPMPGPVRPHAKIIRGSASFDAPQHEQINNIKKVVAGWRHNRSLYPGWFVAPDHVRERLWQGILHELMLFRRVSEELEPVDKLAALAELNWQLETSLHPFLSEFEEAAYGALLSFDISAKTVGTQPLPEEVNWQDFLTLATGLCSALARLARHDGNETHFQRAIAILGSFAPHIPEMHHEIIYHQCLWDAAQGNLIAIKERVDNWAVTNTETAWSLRKAGLLAEIGDDGAACLLLENALAQIRRNRRRDIDDIPALSREGWALYFGLAYTHTAFGGPILSEDSQRSFARWRELRGVECDAFGEYQVIKRLLDSEQRITNGVVVKQQFDLNREGQTYKFGAGLSPNILAAYQMIMLAEKTGIPSSTHNTSLLKEGLEKAAKILAEEEPWLACQIIVRSLPGSGSDIIDVVFSRARIARLSQDHIELLRVGMLTRIDTTLPQLLSKEGQSTDAYNAIATCMELLSRIALRLKAEQLYQLFDNALSYYQSPMVRSRAHFFRTGLADLIKRIFETLTPKETEPLLLKNFSSLLPHEAGNFVSDSFWPDLVEHLPDNYFAPATLRSKEWDKVINDLISQAQSRDGENRKAAIFRLFKLNKWSWLTDGEKEAFANALWAADQLNDKALPGNTNLLPWAFLEMPIPASMQIKEILEAYLLRLETGGVANLETIGSLLSEAKRKGISFDLLPEFFEALKVSINSWANAPVADATSIIFAGLKDDEDRNAINGIEALSPHIEYSHELAGKILSKLYALEKQPDSKYSTYKLYNIIAKLIPERTVELKDRLWRALFSDNDNVASNAVFGVFRWLSKVSETSAPGSNEDISDLVKEVGIAISARRRRILIPGLMLSFWIFNENLPDIQKLIAIDCLHALTALKEEASYDRGDSLPQTPEIRVQCVKLARAMAAHGYSEEAIINDWMDIAAHDPLPEVRNAVVNDEA